MFTKILCFFGLHDWLYMKEQPGNGRIGLLQDKVCLKCNTVCLDLTKSEIEYKEKKKEEDVEIRKAKEAFRLKKLELELEQEIE